MVFHKPPWQNTAFDFLGQGPHSIENPSIFPVPEDIYSFYSPPYEIIRCPLDISARFPKQTLLLHYFALSVK